MCVCLIRDFYRDESSEKGVSVSNYLPTAPPLEIFYLLFWFFLVFFTYNYKWSCLITSKENGIQFISKEKKTLSGGNVQQVEINGPNNYYKILMLLIESGRKQQIIKINKFGLCGNVVYCYIFAWQFWIRVVLRSKIPPNVIENHNYNSFSFKLKYSEVFHHSLLI